MTRKAVAAGLLLLAAALDVCADDIDVNVRSAQATATPQAARFEIVQSTFAVKWTFKLDRYNGNIWQLVKTKSDGLYWEETPIRLRPDIKSASRARFQIFTSGLAARYTFLLDGDTGKTWLLVEGKYKDKSGVDATYYTWEPFEE